jgi:hypothetical protein
MKPASILYRVAIFIVLATAIAQGTEGGPAWKPLAPGLDITVFKAAHPSTLGDSNITVLRIDPKQWDLKFCGLSQTGGSSALTARQWAANQGFTAVINAGMFQADGKTHVGYLRVGEHVNSKRITSYQSVAAAGPVSDQLPRFRIFDLEKPASAIPSIAKDYSLVVQNLRMIQRPGIDKWQPQKKEASQAALGEDDAGRILFIFARSPFSTYEFNEELLHAHIGLVAAQYLEGGPEAQLYIHVGSTELEMFGSYETAFEESDRNSAPWPIPNVLAIKPRNARNK